MLLQCPNCQAGLRLPKPPAPGASVKCPRCQTAFAVRSQPAEVEEAEPGRVRRPAGRRSRQPEASNRPWILGGIGGAALIGGVALAVVLGSGRPQPQEQKPVADRDAEPAPVVPPMPVAAPPPKQPQPKSRPAEPFAKAADRPAPKVLVATLSRTRQVDFDLPRLPGPGGRRAGPKSAGDGKLTLDEIKKAVTFIKIDAGKESATGSGFVLHAEKDGGLVATNCHVVAPAVLARSRDAGGEPRVGVVFDSGLPTEQEVEGQLAAFDPESDLALIRVAGVARMPRPIDPRHAPAPTETMPVLVCGFPFGQALATGSRSPAVTIGKGSVSSVRRDDAGAVALVQIDGALNPGNSGGPVIDSDGRLVGVSVATIQGAGIGIAIPAGELLGLLEGRVDPPTFLAEGVEEKTAVFRAVVPVIDPLRKVRSVSLYVVASAEASAGVDPDGPWKVLEGATKIDLELSDRGPATAQLRLPTEGESHTLVQLAYATEAGVVASRPVPFRVEVGEARTADDAMAMSELNRFPERYEGQTVVVRGALNSGVTKRGERLVLNVHNENAVRPANLAFDATPEVAAQVRELPARLRALPVRLTGVVGKRDARGVAVVQVARIDFIGPGNRIVKTIPSDEGPDDPLIALNRDPDQLVGKTVVLQGLVGPVMTRGPEPDVALFLPNGSRANGLQCTCSRDVATQLQDLGQRREPVPARVTARVEERKVGNRRLLTLLKIELLDPDGKVLKTIE